MSTETMKVTDNKVKNVRARRDMNALLGKKEKPHYRYKERMRQALAKAGYK